jgi:hypothetical protein
MRTSTTQSSILSRINLAVTETNDAYSLSGVNVALRLVHVAYDSYVEDTTDAFGVALGDLQSNNDGKLDQAHTLRTTYRADVVALIIDDSAFCGIGYLGPSINSMFSVTAWNCATGYYSFGHEIGHNFVSYSIGAVFIRPGAELVTYEKFDAKYLTHFSPFCLFLAGMQP